MRTVEWDLERSQVRMIDQRLLPATLEVVSFETVAEIAEAIRNMTVRGAPAIGAAAGFGMALAALTSKAKDVPQMRADLRQAGAELNAARPTAVNLAWAIQRMLGVMDAPASTVAELQELMLREAQRIADEDVETNLAISRYGAELIQDGDTIIHHCNTGALATVDWGTALGVIRMAYQQGKRLHVLVDETRPRLQGARLTAWELQQYGIPYDIISDNMAGYFLRKGEVQRVFFGADRVTANGDVANKVGSYMLALAAHANHVPVYSVFPTSTIDATLTDGNQIPIEERETGEVLDIQIHGVRVTPEGATARNPSFDVTPHHLLTALVTEKGVIYPPFSVQIPRLVGSK